MLAPGTSQGYGCSSASKRSNKTILITIFHVERGAGLGDERAQVIVCGGADGGVNGAQIEDRAGTQGREGQGSGHRCRRAGN